MPLPSGWTMPCKQNHNQTWNTSTFHPPSSPHCPIPFRKLCDCDCTGIRVTRFRNQCTGEQRKREEVFNRSDNCELNCGFYLLENPTVSLKWTKTHWFCGVLGGVGRRRRYTFLLPGQCVPYLRMLSLKWLLTKQGEHMFTWCKGRFESSLAVKGDLKACLL